MAHCVVDRPTWAHAVPQGASLQTRVLSRARLFVRECVPGGSFLRAAAVRTAYVDAPREALALPWIEKLPGEKRIKVLHGQTFVVQHYVGCRLIRAHIFCDEERCRSSPGQPRR
jgi:hypothetical protein